MSGAVDSAAPVDAAAPPPRPGALHWMVSAVSLLVMVLFGAAMLVPMLTHVNPVPADIAETLKVLAVSVVSFWIGSSIGSARKTDLIASR